MKKTTKDKISNIAGLFILLSATLGGLAGTLHLPEYILNTSIIIGALSGAVVAWLTGKGSDGKAKP